MEWDNQIGMPHTFFTPPDFRRESELRKQRSQIESNYRDPEFKKAYREWMNDSRNPINSIATQPVPQGTFAPQSKPVSALPPITSQPQVQSQPKSSPYAPSSMFTQDTYRGVDANGALRFSNV
jgi:hypothetical protein